MKQTAIVFLTLIMVGLSACTQPKETKTDNAKIRVGVFSGGGSPSYVGVIETTQALKIDKDIVPCTITSTDIMNGKLDDLDVIIFPGGSGSTEFNNLGDKASEKVRQFVYDDGKGIIGICAGGFLLSTTPNYPSLRIFPEADIRDGYYDRGRGLVAFHLTDEGEKIFYEVAGYDTLFVQYNDGPIFVNPESGKSNVLGRFYSDVADRPNYPKGTTPGKLIFGNSDYGKGKVFVSVGHPESTPGMRWIVPRMARWVSGNELVPYPEIVVRPQLNKKEFLFYPENEKYEKKLFWTLFSKEDSVVINSLNELYAMRSRASVRWSVGLLRNHSPAIRLQATKYLLKTEYTDAVPDLETAVNMESDPGQKQEMKKILTDLKALIGCN